MKLLQKLFVPIFALLSIGISAQVKDPVKFQLKINELKNNEYEAVLTAHLEKNWHIYSKDIPEDSGIPTEMKVSGKNIELIGKVTEVGKKEDEFSEAFGARIVYYSNSVAFKQKFKLKNPAQPSNVIAEITYQTCDDRVCLAPNTLEFEQNIISKNSESAEIPSQEAIKEESTAVSKSTNEIKNIENSIKVESLDAKNPLTDCGFSAQEESSDDFWIFILGFIGGLLALLTPCVFPMIPLTVSFFTKGTDNKAKGKRDALLYGFFIFVIFVALSLPFHIIDGVSGNIFNEISTNIWLNLFFFVVFLFFALSFFGYYEITLPSWIANKSSKAEQAGGLVGIFFMALTLVIVSFSCTGPILGSLLGSVVTGASDVALLLTYALAGFGLAWAVIFGLLALFPQALQALPKSGAWMNTIKVVLGFIELALALKFLSKADLVSKTFLLKRELFIGIWILITIGLTLYLFGKIRFPHDNKNEKASTPRKIFGIAGISLLIYLIQGLFPSERPKLKLLSGILPPINVSYLHNEKDGFLGIHPIHDYFEAIKTAQKENKPVLIDFTGYGCENCRKMEEFVWTEPDILELLQNEVILASVYIDDKEFLPENEQTSIDMGGGQKKKIKTIGDKWSMFQQVNFNNNSQPHYVLVTPDGKVINKPISGYMPKDDFKKFLDCGINYYKNHKK